MLYFAGQWFLNQSIQFGWKEIDPPPQMYVCKYHINLHERIWQSQSAQASYSIFWSKCVRQTHTLVVLKIQTIGIQKLKMFDLSSKIGNVEKVF
jgi:hypothetical protein